MHGRIVRGAISTLVHVLKDGQEWELAVVWKDPAKGFDNIASYSLSGLSRRRVCRLLGIQGRGPVVFPVPVHAHELHLLQPYATDRLSLPPGTTGELWPSISESDVDLSDGPRKLWPLLAYVIVGGTLGALLWHWGHTAHATWARFALQLGAGLGVALAVWCGGSLLLLVPISLIASRARGKD